MLPQGGVVGSLKDHVVIQVMTGVPDGYVYEETEVCPKDVIRPGTHLQNQAQHTPRPTISDPGSSLRKKVL